MTYLHLTNNQITALCKRYGHKESISRANVVCLRCGFTRGHKDSNEILQAYLTPTLEELKKRIEFFNKIATFPKSNCAKAKLTFNAWKAKN